MPISPSKARSLCTASEYELVKMSSPRSIKTLTPSRLKDKLDRARKLRDKYRDLSKKQSGEARGKRKPTGARAAKGNENTVLKAELFDQTLKRFETALSKADSDTSGRSPKAKKTAQSGASSKKNKTSTSKKDSQAKRGKETAEGEDKKSGSSSIPLSAPVHRPLGRSASLSASGSSSSFSNVFASSLSAQQSRETRRREKSQSSKIGREDSRFAATAREKIQGHVSGQTRRHQAKRDSKG